LSSGVGGPSGPFGPFAVDGAGRNLAATGASAFLEGSDPVGRRGIIFNLLESRWVVIVGNALESGGRVCGANLARRLSGDTSGRATVERVHVGSSEGSLSLDDAASTAGLSA